MAMKGDQTHPALLPDFLSRLHDGELTAAERAHFESHRDRCGECRRAAAEFEAALSLFRSSSVSPPPSDLAARILRRLRAAAPRRSSFGTVFGINLKWAAAFTLAVIAALVGFAVVLEREAARRAILRQAPIPVVLEKGESPASAASKPNTPDARIRPQMPAKDAVEPRAGESGAFAPDASSLRQPAAENAPPAAQAAEQKKALPPAREASEASDFVSPRRRDGASPGPARSLERPGGEGAASASAASAEPGAPARLVILPLDGGGNAPAIISPGASEALADLRGREYFLLVEAAGRVREARLDGKGLRHARPRSKESLESSSAPPSVRNLRFTPGDRPRRLLLRVE